MQMEGWEDYLHTSFYGEHVLFPGLRLTSFGAFIGAALLAAALCLLERYVIVSYSHTLSLPIQGTPSSLTFALSRHWSPFRSVRQSRSRRALWRAGLYAIATLLRLCVSSSLCHLHGHPADPLSRHFLLQDSTCFFP